ncbi:serine/threonine-protein kinase NIM1 [Hydra vulgaris]|uniref:serine/threonine-protein kinase NIM1 n=1 Tax=Hydra vulgaris TaxID=6087 RepID=UPI001F5F944B|nr:serine/threonine-protein kinase NIM1 isoform X1 [Hydra vulgaris]
MAVDILKPNDCIDNTVKNVTLSNEKNNNVSQNLNELPPYQKLVQELSEDERCCKELQLGRRIGFYKIRGDLGSGNFAQVKLSYHCLTKEKVALKILDKTKLDEKTKRLLSREIKSMEKLNHPNIIRIFEVLETPSKIYIALEYACHGELFHKILSNGKFLESEAKVYFGQLTSAVAYMHQCNIIHRDIKAENVFLALNGVCKIGDLGFSTVANPEDKLNTFCGSPPYAAPELFKDDYYIGRYVDIWALGVLLYFMVTGFMPFRADTVGKLKRKILEGSFTIPDHVSATCRFLLTQIIRMVPSDRYSLSEIMRSLWMEGVEFPKPSKSLSLKPVINSIDNSLAEKEALKQLLGFGITEDMIENCTDDSNNCINGTYRIAVYQEQRKDLEFQIEREAMIRKDIEEIRLNKRKSVSKSSSSNTPKSEFCTIL